jgi:hypothetical protein
LDQIKPLTPPYVPSTNFGFECTANWNYRYADRMRIRG